MDLAEITNAEFTQPLREAIVIEDMIATRKLIDSVQQETEITDTRQTVKVYAMAYILELRDGEQYKSPPTLEDIQTWLDAKGLSATLDASVVLNKILNYGTTWDRQGGSTELQAVINDANVKRVLDLAVTEETKKILAIQWQSL